MELAGSIARHTDMKIMRKFLLLSLGVFIAGCGTTDVYRIQGSDSYTVSAQYGSLNGSWQRASLEATGKAESYCRSMNKSLRIINEERSGILGVTPQVATITFDCVNQIHNLLQGG